MENDHHTFYNFTPENFKDSRYEAAVEQLPKGVLIYINRTKQVQAIEEIRPTADGPMARITNIGLVPIDELRLATDKDIALSRYGKNEIREIDGKYFYKL